MSSESKVVSELYAYIQNEPIQPLMPLMHTTSGFSLKDISKNKKLIPKDCKYFKEKLIYLFYGRPAYQVNNNDTIITDSSLYPICFILNPNKINNIKRIFPFDTGGYFEGYYDEFLDPKKENDSLEKRLNICYKYAIGSNAKSASKFITKFFGNNTNYFYGDYLDLKFNYLNYTLSRYYNLLRQTGNPNADDRKYTIEFQTDIPVDLSESILAIALPRIAFNSPEIMQLLKEWKVSGIPYCSIHSTSGKAFHGYLFGIIANFLISQNYINEEAVKYGPV